MEKGHLPCYIGLLRRRQTTKQDGHAEILFTLAVWPSYLLEGFQFKRLMIPIYNQV
jgi:hypothetical protein